MSNIRVEYDGRYPCTCMGTLKIFEDDIEIYNNTYCCVSTGSCGFSGDWEEYVTGRTTLG